jgi:hypothetical protein
MFSGGLEGCCRRMLQSISGSQEGCRKPTFEGPLFPSSQTLVVLVGFNQNGLTSNPSDFGARY